MKIPTKQVKSPIKKRSLKSVKSVKEVVNAAQLPNELTLALGLNVQHYRKELNLTQVNLAYDAEVERSRISKIETGLVNPSLLTIATLAHCLNVTLSELFKGIAVTMPPTSAGGRPRRTNQATLDKTVFPKTKRTRVP